MGDARSPAGDAAPDGASSENDAGVPPGSSVASPPAELTAIGEPGVLLLRGTILAPQGAITEGEILVENDTILCVAEECSAHSRAASATVIDTHGVISPGLIDAHNHIGYDFLPEWIPSDMALFMNRYEWADNPEYEAFVQPYAANRATGTHYCPAAKWAELRSIAHGTTTIQGQGFQQKCIERLARNAENYTRLGPSEVQTYIGSVRDIADTASSGVDRTKLVANFRSGSTTRFFVHMTEGYAGSNIELEFMSFAGRDMRANRTIGLLRDTDTDATPFRTAVLIHALGLSEAEIDEASLAGARIVWSPSSNLVLYGRTANIAAMLEAGLTIGIGPDWTPSGEDELLSEMRFAHRYGETSGVGALTPERIWRMATSDGADVVGLELFIGQLAEGYRADITVFGRTGEDPYRAVLDSRAEDVRLVMIDGLVHYGDLELESLALNGLCDTIDACGRAKFLCAAAESVESNDRADETVDEIEMQLFDILEGVGYPADEQYMRGNQLLPLIACAN